MRTGLPMNELDPLIDAALESYPKAPLPPRFVRRTMAAIRAAHRPRFRLEFLDLALPGFLALFAATLVGLALWLAAAFNPLWVLELQVRLNWYAENPGFLPLGWIAGAGIAVVCAFALAGLGLALALDRPVRAI